MQLAFTLFKYFPYGGLQRDFLRIALACQARSHAIRVYTLSWQGDVPAGFEVVKAPVKALSNHRRYEKLADWVRKDLAARPADRLWFFRSYLQLERLTPFAKWLWRTIAARSGRKQRIQPPVRVFTAKAGVTD